jgi:hypothetical protein
MRDLREGLTVFVELCQVRARVLTRNCPRFEKLPAVTGK